MSDWLADSVDRVWRLGERRLRAYQQAGLRPPPEDRTMSGLEAVLAARRGVRGSEARSGPLVRLAKQLSLGRGEEELLSFALAAAVDPLLGDLFAALRGRRGLDLALVADVLELNRSERAALLDAGVASRPLLHFRLLAADFVMPPEVVSALVGEGRARAPASFADLVLDADLRRELETLAALPALPSLLLVGPRGAGKRECAARLAAAGGRALQVFDPQSVDKTRLDESLRLAQREALLLDAALYVGPIVDMPRGLDGHPGPLFVGIEATRAPRLATTRPMHELVLPLPSAEARSELWRRALPDLDTTAPARDFRLTPGEIAQAAREAQLAGLDEHTLRAAVHRRLRNELGELARRLPAGVRLDDLVLPPAELARVRELIARKRFAARVYGEWGFGGAVDYGKGLVALVSGPPGTGKTLLARAIAHEVGLDLYQVDLSQIFSRWVGETEKAIARVFEQAERAHAVLLFDEADALFAKRTGVDDSNDRYANLTVNYLLQRLEEYSGVAVLTTNKEASLDEALARRLSLHLRLDVPDEGAREELWHRHLPPGAPGAAGVDVERLAREFELTGGTIKNVALRAAFLAAARDQPLSTALLRYAAWLEMEDMGRVVMRADVDESESEIVHANGELLDFCEG